MYDNLNELSTLTANLKAMTSFVRFKSNFNDLMSIKQDNEKLRNPCSLSIYAIQGGRAKFIPKIGDNIVENQRYIFQKRKNRNKLK